MNDFNPRAKSATDRNVPSPVNRIYLLKYYQN